MHPRRKILIVDDDERTLRVVSGFLSSKGYEVISSEGPFVAPILGKERPDLVILDINMPLLTGDRIAEILERQGCTGGAPFLFFSGEQPKKVERIARSFPRAGWVSKQDGLEQLLLKIRSMIG